MSGVVLKNQVYQANMEDSVESIHLSDSITCTHTKSCHTFAFLERKNTKLTVRLIRNVPHGHVPVIKLL